MFAPLQWTYWCHFRPTRRSVMDGIQLLLDFDMCSNFQNIAKMGNSSNALNARLSKLYQDGPEYQPRYGVTDLLPHWL